MYQSQQNIEEVSIVTNSSGIIQSFNEAAEKFLGYSAKSVINESITKIFPEIEVQNGYLQIQKGLLTEQYARHENGKTFILFFRLHEFKLADSSFFIFIIKDIKRHHHYEQELDHSTQELLDLKMALDESTIVAFTDTKGKIKYVNQKFCEISKYSQDELIGKAHRIINSGHHSKEFMKQLWSTISSGEVWKGEIKNKAKDGSYYWVDTTIVPFLDSFGKPYQYLAIRTEITEHKKVQEQLNRLVDELSDLKYALDVSAIVAITDAKGRITYVNDKFSEISKYSKDEIIGNNHRMINSGFHPKSFFKELWETIQSGKVWRGEIKNKAKDGSFYWVDTTIVPFLNDNGLPYQYLAIRYEITKRKQIEDELHLMMTRLISLQEEERRTLSRELHDGVGQNLYSLLISISRLKNEIEHPLLEHMLQEVTTLIEDIRNISWELRPSVLDDLGLVPAIRSFINRFSDHYHFTIKFESTLKRRLSNEVETCIYRVIQEALANMRKYSGVQRGIVSLKEENETILVDIIDAGKGFDLYSRKGTGLFSMEERAKHINGVLTIHSSEMKGTHIHLSIPIHDE